MPAKKRGALYVMVFDVVRKDGIKPRDTSLSQVLVWGFEIPHATRRADEYVELQYGNKYRAEFKQRTNVRDILT